MEILEILPRLLGLVLQGAIESFPQVAKTVVALTVPALCVAQHEEDELSEGLRGLLEHVAVFLSGFLLGSLRWKELYKECAEG